MKILIKTFFLLSTIYTFSQIKDTVFLKNIDTVVNNQIKNQGYKLFKKTEYYISNEKKYNIINYFWVNTKKSVLKIDYDSEQTFLNNFYFTKSCKNKFQTQISWNFIDDTVVYSSDFKKFYKNDLEELSFCKFLKSAGDKFMYEKILFIFYIESTSLFTEFIVLKNKQIFIYDSSNDKLYSFQEFKNNLEDNNFLQHFLPQLKK